MFRLRRARSPRDGDGDGLLPHTPRSRAPRTGRPFCSRSTASGGHRDAQPREIVSRSSPAHLGRGNPQGYPASARDPAIDTAILRIAPTAAQASRPIADGTLVPDSRRRQGRAGAAWDRPLSAVHPYVGRLPPGSRGFAYGAYARLGRGLRVSLDRGCRRANALGPGSFDWPMPPLAFELVRAVQPVIALGRLRAVAFRARRLAAGGPRDGQPFDPVADGLRQRAACPAAGDREGCPEKQDFVSGPPETVEVQQGRDEDRRWPRPLP